LATLESPQGSFDDWSSQLYRALGEDVSALRPVFTGDVFQDVTVALPGATTKPRTLIVLTHPCSMRQDGVALRKRLLVAVVKQRTATSDGWPVDRSFDLMPLPNLDAAGGGFVAEFDNVAIVESALLDRSKRIAVLEVAGLNLLMQRFVHQLTRVVVKTSEFADATLPLYEEVDLIEDWVTYASEKGLDAIESERHCHDWLREMVGSSSRQELLRDPQSRSRLRRDAAGAAKALFP
jgi:hypothetical protein